MYGTHFMVGRPVSPSMSSAERLSLLKQVSERVDSITSGIKSMVLSSSRPTTFPVAMPVSMRPSPEAEALKPNSALPVTTPDSTWSPAFQNYVTTATAVLTVTVLAYQNSDIVRDLIERLRQAAAKAGVLLKFATKPSKYSPALLVVPSSDDLAYNMLGMFKCDPLLEAAEQAKNLMVAYIDMTVGELKKMSSNSPIVKSEACQKILKRGDVKIINVKALDMVPQIADGNDAQLTALLDYAVANAEAPGSEGARFLALPGTVVDTPNIITPQIVNNDIEYPLAIGQSGNMNVLGQQPVPANALAIAPPASMLQIAGP